MSVEKKAAVLSDAEFRRVLAVARSARNGLRNVTLLYFSFALGLRAKEMSMLKVADIMSHDGQLKNEVLLTAAHTKGGKQRLVYLVNKDARHALSEYLAVRSVAPSSVSKAPLFMSAKGGAFTPNTLQMLMKRLFTAVGLHNASSHSGRRTFATSLIEKGVDIKAVSTLMGHATVNMTARYVQDNPVRLQRICQDLRLGVERR